MANLNTATTDCTDAYRARQSPTTTPFASDIERLRNSGTRPLPSPSSAWQRRPVALACAASRPDNVARLILDSPNRVDYTEAAAEQQVGPAAALGVTAQCAR